jgi:hypothetical protein
MSRIPIIAAGSEGRRNTDLKFPRMSLQNLKPFADVD